MTAGVDGQVLKGGGRLAAYANFVKVAHTVFALPFTVFTGADGSVLGVHTGELHPEHLESLATVLDDLQNAKIDVATARARLAGRI